MENAINKPPRKITDTFEAVCSNCGQIAYTEQIVCEEGEYQRFVSGSYKQLCDETGAPTGAVIPLCNCNGATYAKDESRLSN